MSAGIGTKSFFDANGLAREAEDSMLPEKIEGGPGWIYETHEISEILYAV